MSPEKARAERARDRWKITNHRDAWKINAAWLYSIGAVIAVCLIVSVGGFGFLTVRVLSEADKRTDQFCKLTNGVHLDRVKQVAQTRAFLASPAGRPDTAFNTAIRANLPRLLRVATEEERLLPRDCRDRRPAWQSRLVRRTLGPMPGAQK